MGVTPRAPKDLEFPLRAPLSLSCSLARQSLERPNFRAFPKMSSRCGSSAGHAGCGFAPKEVSVKGWSAILSPGLVPHC